MDENGNVLDYNAFTLKHVFAIVVMIVSMFGVNIMLTGGHMNRLPEIHNSNILEHINHV